MKRLLFISLMAFVGLFCNAQIYSSIQYFDKFDDVIKKEQRKAIISISDSTIVVEEKGKKPITYNILNPVESGTVGSKDEVVNLVDDIYGYQSTWCVVRQDMMDKYNKAYIDFFKDSTEENLKKIQPFWIFAVHRTITTQYTHSFVNEIFWLQDEMNNDKLGKGINRIIYSKK